MASDSLFFRRDTWIVLMLFVKPEMPENEYKNTSKFDVFCAMVATKLRGL